MLTAFDSPLGSRPSEGLGDNCDATARCPAGGIFLKSCALCAVGLVNLESCENHPHRTFKVSPTGNLPLHRQTCRLITLFPTSLIPICLTKAPNPLSHRNHDEKTDKTGPSRLKNVAFGRANGAFFFGNKVNCE